MGITIEDVKVIGMCEKHATNDMPQPKYKDGSLISKEDVICFGCDI